MMRDSLQFGTAEEQAINQYLRDKAEEEIATGDLQFRSWLLNRYELASEPVMKLIITVLSISPLTAIGTAADRLHDEYLEYRIENADARADAYRALFEKTEPME